MQVNSECFRIMLLEGTKNINMKTLFTTFLTVKVCFEWDKGKVSQHLPVGPQMFQLLVRSINIETKKSPNLFHPIYPIPASLWVLTTHGKLSEQKIMSPVKSLGSQLPTCIDILNHENFGTIFLLFWCTINFMIFFGTA